MNLKTIKLLKELVKHLEYYNMLAPFPVYGTEYIVDVKLKINEMENTKTNYDDLPVAACKYCNSLHIQIDDVENDVCMRCGSVNEIVIYTDIDDYLEKTKKDE
jgi:phage FluMu protein Com